MPEPTLVEAEIWTVARTEQGNAVLIRPKGSDLAVPIFIGTLETQSILIGFGGVDVPRPLTHDLLITILKSFGSAVDHVEITDLQDETYYARIVLESVSGFRDFDARPSDAIAIALRVKCPVFIAEHIVDSAGINVNLVAEGMKDTSLTEKDLTEIEKRNGERAKLERELDDAVADEDYETAARLRDRIKKLEEGA